MQHQVELQYWGSTVKLGDKERFDKEQIGAKEPFSIYFIRIRNFLHYRVSEGKVFFLIWLWEIEIYKLDYIWWYFSNADMWTFWLLEPIFKKVT